MRSPSKNNDIRRGPGSTDTRATARSTRGGGLTGQQTVQTVQAASSAVSAVAGCYQAAQQTRRTELECGDRREARQHEDRQNERYYADRKDARHDAALERETAHRETMAQIDNARVDSQARREAAAQLRDDLREGRVSPEDFDRHFQTIKDV